MKNCIIKSVLAIGVILYIVLYPSGVMAADYVLPYPSYMPGSRLYHVSEWWDILGQYWNFGDIAGMKYERAMSDKYLIQAQVLFEYGQYKFAIEALDNSDKHFSKALVHSIELSYKKKDDGTQLSILKDQAQKHIEALDTLAEKTPDTVTWNDERTETENLPISMLFAKSKILRNYANR